MPVDGGLVDIHLIEVVHIETPLTTTSYSILFYFKSNYDWLIWSSHHDWIIY